MDGRLDLVERSAATSGSSNGSRPSGGAGAASDIEITHVSHVFENEVGERSVALQDISFEVRQGEFLAIVGPSGCGKSTVLNLISSLISPTRGTVKVRGDEVDSVPDDLGYMPARDCLLPWRSVARNVEFPLELAGGTSKAARRAAAREMIEGVGLKGYERHMPGELSHGMRQRVALARTFITQPRLLLMDEPFSALDAQTRVKVQELFLSLMEGSERTAVLITHDVAEAVALADRVLVFTKAPGRIKSSYVVDLPRPRSVSELMFSSDEFQAIIRQIWADLEDD